MAKQSKQSSTRGGERAGAGRKAKLIDPVKKLITLETAMVQKIAAKEMELSQFLREAGERRLAEGW